MDEFDRERRRIIRRMGLLTWGLGAAAVLLAVGGGALIAWFFERMGYPFVRTWIVISLLLILVPVMVHLSPWPKRKEDDRGS